MDKRIKRLEALRIEIGDIANSFAGDVTGNVAVELHGSANRIGTTLRMLRMLEEGITADDKVRQAEEWCDNQPFPMGPAQRHLITSILAR